VITRGLREFLDRDWQAVRESKDRYWGDRIARLGAGEALRVAEELRRQARLCDPTWPDAALRDEDLGAHIRLARLLHRVRPTRCD